MNSITIRDSEVYSLHEYRCPLSWLLADLYHGYHRAPSQRERLLSTVLSTAGLLAERSSNCLHNEGMGDPRYEHITIMPNGILLDTPEFFSPTDSITNYCYISMSNYIQSILRFYKRQSLTIPSIYNMRAASFSSLIGILRINERITF